MAGKGKAFRLGILAVFSEFYRVKPWITIGFLLLSLAGSGQPAFKTFIHFDFDKYNITSRAKATLDSILSLGRINDRKLQLYGHCDSLGDNSYNDILSIRRVEAARDYLLGRGLKPSNITVDSGFGKRKPLNENADALQRQLNRRVEIVVSEPYIPLQERLDDPSVKEGSQIVLRNLNFFGGRHVLVPESWEALKELLMVLRKNPALTIEIQGHVCCTHGQEGYDTETRTFTLSSNRAQYIYQYLIANGIDSKRLTWKAFGNQRPLVYPEDTPEKRLMNRRVEIRILSK